MLTKSTIILTYHEPGLPLTEDVIYSAFVSGNSVAKVISPVADLEVLTGMFSDNYCLEMTVRFTRTNPTCPSSSVIQTGIYMHEYRSLRN